MSKTTASGALGLAFASALAWLCCLPVASGALGITFAALAPAVGPWWPVLAAASLLLLGVAVVQSLRGGRASNTERCEIRSDGDRRWLFLSVVGGLTLALLTLPWWSAEIVYRLIR